jgi:methylated-DNA-[protein]-cysteine S-methyltransferase
MWTPPPAPLDVRPTPAGYYAVLVPVPMVIATHFTMVDSPVGELVLTAHGAGLSGVYFERRAPVSSAQWLSDNGTDGAASAALAMAREQLAAYFRGELTTFDLPLSAMGTPFQERVWRALREIEFGRSISYVDLARRIGAPSASRAVGAANGRNPIPIIVPCHRVIGASGALTGFGGGIERKRWLLDHERAVAGVQGEQRVLALGA